LKLGFEVYNNAHDPDWHTASIDAKTGDAKAGKYRNDYGKNVLGPTSWS
jgi:hypothetical protein